jgi:alpha-L-rhamnosidase
MCLPRPVMTIEPMNAVNRRGFLGGAAGTAAAMTVTPSGTALAGEGGGPLMPVRLTAEHMTSPLGIEAKMPRLGWWLEAGGRDRRQSAYQITVGTAPGGADVWDSGKVVSAEQTAIVYAGRALRSRVRYHWRVRVWDETGHAGPHSRPAWFEMALLEGSDWVAQWIGSGVVIPPSINTVGPQPGTTGVLRPGGRLGQTFISDGRIAAVAIRLQVSEGTGGCVMTLRRGDFDGRVVGRRELSGLSGQELGRLEFPEPLDGGAFSLELSDGRGAVEWEGGIATPQRPDYTGGDAYIDGAVQEDTDFWLYVIPPDPPADPLLRKEFDIGAEIASARLYICGLGHAETWINGRRVGDAVLEPVGTDYDRRVLYVTHDVTGLLRRGRNAIGVALGRGMFATRAPETDNSQTAPWIAEPQVRAQLEVTLKGGRRVTVASGRDWQITEGPTVYDGMQTGQTYDARRARRLRGWDRPGHRAMGWRAAAVVTAPAGRLEAYAAEPTRAHEPVRAVKVTRPAEGVRLYDFRATLTGWTRLRGRFAAGTTVRMLYGEKLDAKGRISVGTPGWNDNPSVTGRFQVDEYIAAGHGTETWEPTFACKGFRYVEVTGTDRDLDLVAIPVHSDVAHAMDLRVDHPVEQWLVDAFSLTALNGLHGYPDVSPLTRLGWTGNTHFAGQPMLYEFGMAAIFDKWLEDLRSRQEPDGALPLTAPFGADLGIGMSPTWTGVYPFLVHQYWLTYGDRSVPARHFAAVGKYVEWLLTLLQDDILPFDSLADWYPPDPQPYPIPPEGTRLVGTAAVIKSLQEATALADLLGDTGKARRWRERAAQIVNRFNQEFLDAQAGHYSTENDVGYRQTSNAIPLEFGLVPKEHIATVAAGLAKAVEDNGRFLDTGCAGIASLPYALSDHGRADLAHAVLTRTEYPSYGYLRSLGATTLWENWEQDARGHNDFLFGNPVRWLVERVVGLEALRPGWARFAIRPNAFGPLKHAHAALDTARGRVAVAWRRRDSTVELKVQVPVNSVAEITLPGGTREVGSGRHRFESKISG